MGAIEKNINNDILALWDEWRDRLELHYKPLFAPLVYGPIKRGELLFVGSNPSFSTKVFKKLLTGTKYAKINPVKFYTWKGKDDFDIATALELERLAREKADFFSKFKEIAFEISGDRTKWEHVDLFFNRVTRQKDLEEKIIDDKDFTILVSAQMKLSAQLVRHVNPKIIIVANARASKEFETKLASEFPLEWNEEFGYHTTKVEMRVTPVFLASMFTGQRAMDKGSFRRLVWHIRRALKQKSTG